MYEVITISQLYLKVKLRPMIFELKHNHEIIKNQHSAYQVRDQLFGNRKVFNPQQCIVKNKLKFSFLYFRWPLRYYYRCLS